MFEVKPYKDGVDRAVIRAEHCLTRDQARNALAHHHGTETDDLTAVEVEQAIREVLRCRGDDTYTAPEDMYAVDWLWVDKHLKKVWKETKKSS